MAKMPKGTPRCLGCGGWLLETRNESFHNLECRRERVRYAVEELEFLRGTDRPENLAARLGFTATSLVRALHRHGRPDLAKMFEQEEGVANSIPMPAQIREFERFHFNQDGGEMRFVGTTFSGGHSLGRGVWAA